MGQAIQEYFGGRCTKSRGGHPRAWESQNMAFFWDTYKGWVLGDLDGRKESGETNHTRRAEFWGRMELGDSLWILEYSSVGHYRRDPCGAEHGSLWWM